MKTPIIIYTQKDIPGLITLISEIKKISQINVQKEDIFDYCRSLGYNHPCMVFTDNGLEIHDDVNNI